MGTPQSKESKMAAVKGLIKSQDKSTSLTAGGFGEIKKRNSDFSDQQHIKI